MVEESVIEETGVRTESGEWRVEGAESLEELEEELKRCEEKEEYERAAEIQKKIEELKNNEE
jgi:protein-arginine kinase activator protein McsA